MRSGPGFIPHTLAEDGDPIEVLVAARPVPSGSASSAFAPSMMIDTPAAQ
jgi:inorganic pyrophosphatase